MITATQLPDAIEWHEGMLLAPQHFQQLALRHEALLSYRAGAIAPHSWGVEHVEVDRVLLVNGTFRVLSLEAIMPDGLVVSHQPRQGAETLELDLSPSAEEMRERTVTIHLAVPVRRVRSNGSLTRYESLDGPPVADETTGDGEIRIPRLRPKMLLIAGDRSPDKYVTLPLARVRFENDGYVMVDYVPPSLAVRAASPVGRMCADTVRRLREKATFLAEQVRSPSLTLNSPLALLKRYQIQSMVGSVPLVEALLNSDVAHPFALYAAYCGLAGNVAAVGNSLVPPVFPAYDHEDPLAGFQQVQAYVQKSLDEGIQETHQSFVFQRRGGVFYLPFQPDWAGRKLVLAARARSGTTEKDVLNWYKNCIIGAETQVAALRQRRILGVPRRQVDDSDGLVPGRGRLLFELDSTSSSLVPNEKLLVTRFDERADPELPAEIVLYVRSR